MKSIVVALMLISTAVAAEPSIEVKAFEKSSAYHAYWLIGAEPEYLTLLVMPWPIEKFSGHKRQSNWLFDNTALTFRTYKHDSLWDSPFKPVQQCSAMDADATTVTLDDVTYHYEAADIQDVVRLLKNPLGKIPLHRRVATLEDADQTAKAFRLLLEDQLKSEKK